MKKTTFLFCKNQCTVLFLIMFSVSNFITAQNPTQVLIESWNGANWEPESRELNSYDINGFQTESLSQNLVSPPNDWQNSYRETYTNNSNGTVAELLFASWDEILNQWENSDRETNTYNTSQQLLTKITATSFGTNIWTDNKKESYSYDDQNRIISYLQENWNLVDTWFPWRQELYTRNTDGSLAIKLEQGWNFPVANSWNDLNRETFQYNTGGFYQISTSQQWQSGTWVNESQSALNIDGDNHVTYVLNKVWDSGTGSFVNSSQGFITYNTAGYLSEIIFQYWNGSDWLNAQRVTYTNNLSTLAFSKESNRIFPNPTNAVLNFQLGNDKVIDAITITDLTGKIVLKQVIKSNQVNVESLATGVYIIQGQSGDEKFESKFVKL